MSVMLSREASFTVARFSEKNPPHLRSLQGNAATGHHLGLCTEGRRGFIRKKCGNVRGTAHPHLSPRKAQRKCQLQQTRPAKPQMSIRCAISSPSLAFSSPSMSMLTHQLRTRVIKMPIWGEPRAALKAARLRLAGEYLCTPSGCGAPLSSRRDFFRECTAGAWATDVMLVSEVASPKLSLFSIGRGWRPRRACANKNSC
ncbi:hypothetical protein BC628DRAFT_123053 [Trametes gibbosa]|nr:hypothetical protein BC628DRAFT_123053 [Trametes gibbosa]